MMGMRVLNSQPVAEGGSTETQNLVLGLTGVDSLLGSIHVRNVKTNCRWTCLIIMTIPVISLYKHLCQLITSSMIPPLNA